MFPNLSFKSPRHVFLNRLQRIPLFKTLNSSQSRALMPYQQNPIVSPHNFLHPANQTPGPDFPTLSGPNFASSPPVDDPFAAEDACTVPVYDTTQEDCDAIAAENYHHDVDVDDTRSSTYDGSYFDEAAWYLLCTLSKETCAVCSESFGTRNGLF
jgi:hypothetical protein